MSRILVFDPVVMMENINRAVEFVNNKFNNFRPTVGVILGTGLGGFRDEIDIKDVLPLAHIPNSNITDVENLGHSNQNFITGMVGKTPVLAMEGRIHFYEGYKMHEIGFLIRVMAKLGIKYLIITSAAGALNRDFKQGDIVAIISHMNRMGVDPLVGPNLDDFGPRFPAVTTIYTDYLRDMFIISSRDMRYEVKIGVHVAIPGPCPETTADMRYLKMIGADTVGMSTIPEATFANHAGVEVLGLAIVTDELDPNNPVAFDGNDTITVAESLAGPKLKDILPAFLCDPIFQKK